MLIGAADIDRLVVSREERFAYYIPNNAESFIKAVSDLTNYLASSGPFDGIVAFSQAASLASAVLLLQEVRDIRVRCAIFFSGRSPFIDAGPLPLSNPLVAASERVISIPTAHIWGANDRIEPGEAAILSEMCDPDKRQIHVHGSGHEVPGPRDKEGLEESANAIRRMLFRL
jgi:pimeloyl-ACP methyl ester carboxylesterase